MLDFIRLMIGVAFGFTLIYLFIKALGWSPVLYDAINTVRKSPEHVGAVKVFLYVLWGLSAIWYAISVLIVFFTGVWVIFGFLQSARDWWHSSNK